MKSREIDLFGQISSQVPDAENSRDRWISNYMRGRREKISGDVPYIEFDWKSLARYL